MDVQRITTPEGTEMVVLAAGDYDILVALADEGSDRAVARAEIEGLADGGPVIPGDVVRMIAVDGRSPLAAWRKHRRLSQPMLARATGLSQVWISRIENGGGYGSPDTREKLAAALGIPAGLLDEG